MSLRLLHTADWQLGKPFQNLPTEVAALVREARVATVRTIAALATRHEAAAVLVAGDIFDSNLVPERTIVQALAAMRGFAGPWVLLPGNHDARLAEGVWSRLERLGRPENVLLADSPSPIALADGRLVVLPAPLTERHATDDL
ncbi:MAG: exonuclease SbcCD subunit D, partial [Geminicoccaceae bacterium]